jgi:hypothetical protein
MSRFPTIPTKSQLNVICKGHSNTVNTVSIVTRSKIKMDIGGQLFQYPVYGLTIKHNTLQRVYVTVWSWFHFSVGYINVTYNWSCQVLNILDLLYLSHYHDGKDLRLRTTVVAWFNATAKADECPCKQNRPWVRLVSGDTASSVKLNRNNICNCAYPVLCFETENT